MPLVPDLRFVRQRRVDDSHVGIVIPGNAELNPTLGHRLDRASGPPTDPPRTFSFHYLDFPVHEALLRDGAKAFVGAYRRIEGVFMSPKRYEQLLEAENLVEDIGLADLVTRRDDGRFHEGTTADFLAEVEQQEA